jgi:hypothetical protein
MGGGSGNGLTAGDTAETDTAADEQLLAELAEGDFDTDSNVVEVYTYTLMYYYSLLITCIVSVHTHICDSACVRI